MPRQTPVQPTLTKALTVSEFVKIVRTHLQTAIGVVSVQGEVTGYRTTKDTLVFFELKDEGSRVLCFMMRWELQFPIADGMEVKVTGYPSLFQNAGRFHLRAQQVEPVGAGALQQAFELLKKKLAGEGLFDASRKRSLPRFPASLGLITSPDAAAYTDVLRILNNRWGGLDIHLTPVGVQGAEAVGQIVGAIQYQNRVVQPDVIILTRGGGSLEDLQAFNSEAVARAIYASQIPIVCGIGHERDTTIADWVADVRASTPSNAAERVVPDRGQVLFEIGTLADQAERTIERRVNDYRSAVSEHVHRLETVFRQQSQRAREIIGAVGQALQLFSERVRASRSETEHLLLRLSTRMDGLTRQSLERARHLSELLNSLNPERILARGYSMTLTEAGDIIRSPEQLSNEQILTTKLARGQVRSRAIKP